MLMKFEGSGRCKRGKTSLSTRSTPFREVCMWVTTASKSFLTEARSGLVIGLKLSAFFWPFNCSFDVA